MKKKPTYCLLQLLLLFGILMSTISKGYTQEGPTGAQQFKVGDKVEATYLGDWKPATIIGPLQTNEFGKTYEIHFEGQTYSFGRISAQYVRPRSTVKDKGSEKTGTTPPATIPPAATNGALGGGFRMGEKVLYRGGGALWSGDAEIVSYDAAKRQYRLRFPSGSGDIVPCHSVARPGTASPDFFVGKWAVFISGATSTFVKGGDLYRRFSSGASLPPLEIRGDGTYTWRSDKGKVIRGQWKPREDVPGITILKGLDGKDWTVYESTEGYATTAKTVDEIRFHHLPSGTGYYMAYRIGENKSCVLKGRTFPK